jgi:hypothetical protein
MRKSLPAPRFLVSVLLGVARTSELFHNEALQSVYRQI